MHIIQRSIEIARNTRALFQEMSERWHLEPSPMIAGHMASARRDPGQLQEPPNVLAGQSPYRTNSRHRFHQTLSIPLSLIPDRVENGRFRAWHSSPSRSITLSVRKPVVRIQHEIVRKL